LDLRDEANSNVSANVHRLNDCSHEAANVVEYGRNGVGRGHDEDQVHHASLTVGRRIQTNL